MINELFQEKWGKGGKKIKKIVMFLPSDKHVMFSFSLFYCITFTVTPE
jgi:hypothetical protein